MATRFLGSRNTATGTTGAGSAAAYGTKPVLPTTGALQTNLSGILNSAIPNFSGLSGQASGIIGSALSGQLPPDVQNLIQDNAAAQAVMGGMPGSSRMSGTLFGNKTLRDLGTTSLARQDSGVKDLIGLLQGVSGAAAPTYGQAQEQENARAKYEAAPDPRAAAAEEERLYNKYSNPAAGTVASPAVTPGSFEDLLRQGWTREEITQGRKLVGGTAAGRGLGFGFGVG